MSSRPPDHSIPLSEPVTNITYAGRLPVWSYLFADNELHSGLASYNPTSLQVPVKDLSWSYQTNGQKEELYGSDFSWTKLTLLEPRPHLAFAAQPAMNVILPAGSDAHTLFRVSGSPAGGSVPIFVRILLYPRLRSAQLILWETGFPRLPGPFAIFVIGSRHQPRGRLLRRSGPA